MPDVVHAQRTKISEAMKKWGGFYATGHGLEKNELIHNLRKEARNFFNMKTEEKEKLQITACNPLGWSCSEMTKVVRSRVHKKNDERLTTAHLPLDIYIITPFSFVFVSPLYLMLLAVFVWVRASMTGKRYTM